eukprot:1159153-Pelagomonas_calceolata.AAC.2
MQRVWAQDDGYILVDVSRNGARAVTGISEVRVIYTAHTLDQLKKLGIDSQRSETPARKLHAHSVQYAHKLVTTRCAMDNDASHSQ